MAAALRRASLASPALTNATGAIKAGSLAEAEAILTEHLRQSPNDAPAIAKLGEIAISRGRRDYAIVMLRRALTIAPDLEEARLLLIDVLTKLERSAEALREIEQLSPARHERFNILTLRAALLGKLGMHEDEIETYRTVLKTNPDNAHLWMSMGHALKTVGQTDEAIHAYRRAIKLKPSLGESWWSLANLKTMRFDDRDISAMRKALRGKLTNSDALHFHFALGKAFEDRNDAARSFEHYAAGNALRMKNLGPGDKTARGWVDRAIATLTPELFAAHSGKGCPAPDPIFVVGLQRSGSTLVEQILASHPLVEGTSELLAMSQLFDELEHAGQAAGGDRFTRLARLDGSAIRKIGETYIARTRPFRLTDRPYFVDKLPANWMNVGLIRLALPNAKIIDARRHPMACGFSNFKQHFATGVSFAYSLDSIGKFYANYVRMMDHLNRVQPGAIHRVVNERLIDDPEAQVRALLAYCGLPFDPACLQFHRNVRAVRSASAGQVRRPINRDGVDYWKRYEPHLGPLKAALGPALENWDRDAAR